MLREVAIRLGLLAAGLALAVLGVEALARFVPGLLLPGALRTPLQLKALERQVSRQLRESYGVDQPYEWHEAEPTFRAGRPHVRYPSYGLDYSTTVEYDSLGIRDREPEALRDRPVALLLGDSFVEARQHPADATPSARLEALLEERGQAWWVVNAGIGGSGTTNQLHLFEYLAPRLRPRLVILLFFPGNDLVNNSLPFQSYDTLSTRELGVDLDRRPLRAWPAVLRQTPRSYYRPGPGGGLVYVPRRTPLASALRPGELERFVAALRSERRQIVACRDALRSDRFPWSLARRLMPHAYTTLAYRLGTAPLLRCRTRLDGVPMEGIFSSEQILAAYPDWIDESWRVTGLLLERLAQDAAAAGCRLALAVLPHSIDVDPERRALLLGSASAASPAAGTPLERVVRMGRDLGLPTLDLTPAFRGQEDPASLYLPLDPHLSSAGVELLAQQLLAAFFGGSG